MNCIKPRIFRPKVIKFPNCNNCKYSFKQDGVNYCKLFKYFTVKTDVKNFDYYATTDMSRNDVDLCGPDGKYFKEKETPFPLIFK